MKKTAIIIGASGEIGLETAKKFANEGYDLALTYNKNKVDFKSQIDCDDIKIKAYPLDLKSDDISKTFIQIASDFKYIDTLVFCSGIAQKRALIFDVSDEEINDLFEVNIKSAIKCIKYFAKMTADKHPANIVLVSSFVEKMGCSCESVYAATKSAMNGLCRSLASELGNLGIRINVVAPGFIDTKMNANLTDEEKAEIADMTPLQTLGSVSDVANAIVFLSSKNASFITGQILYVDGGLILE